MKAVLLDILTNEETPIGRRDVVFGEGDNEITISVHDDAVTVTTLRRLVVHPRTANSVILGTMR